jgi:hypothetical protein
MLAGLDRVGQRTRRRLRDVGSATRISFRSRKTEIEWLTLIFSAIAKTTPKPHEER